MIVFCKICRIALTGDLRELTDENQLNETSQEDYIRRAIII